MRASMTARWAPCWGNGWKMRPEGRAGSYPSTSSPKEVETLEVGGVGPGMAVGSGIAEWDLES